MFFRFAILILVSLELTACAASGRLKNIGRAPEMARTESPEALFRGERISLPMPAVASDAQAANSLWRIGAKSFFKDQRARRRGDIVTVVIDIDDRAQLDNRTERTRANGEGAELPAFAGSNNASLTYCRTAPIPRSWSIFRQTPQAAAKGPLIAAKTLN